jgi:hypothetical protein
MSFQQTEQLRRRHNAASSLEESPSIMAPEIGKGLSAPSLLKSAPNHAGPALKLHVPLLFTLLPTFLQRFVSYCLPFLAPSWKPRFLVQIGGYLYKFENDSSKTPKGSPIPVDAVDVHIFNDLSQLKTVLPANYSTVICISSLRKESYFALPTKQEAQVWLNTIQQARQENVRRKMGHAAGVPYPHQYWDTLGESLCKTKDRIRQRVQESEMREMEMVSMEPRGGYYG